MPEYPLALLSDLPNRLLAAYSPTAVGQLDIPLPAGYDFFEIKAWLNFSADADIHARFSNDGGSNFRSGASDYGWITTRSFVGGATTAAGDNADDKISLMASDAGSGNGVHLELTISGAPSASAFTGIHGALRKKVTNEGVETFGGRVTTAEANDYLRLFCDAETFSGVVIVLGYATSPLSQGHAGVHLLSQHSPSDDATLDVDFPDGYEFYEILGWLQPATDDVLPRLRFDDGGGFDDTNEYDSGSGRVDLSEGDGGHATGSAAGIGHIQLSPIQVGSGANEFVSFKVTIHRAKDAAFTYVTVEFLVHNPTSGREGGYIRASHNVAASLDAFRLLFSSGNIAAGEVRLIGIP